MVERNETTSFRLPPRFRTMDEDDRDDALDGNLHRTSYQAARGLGNFHGPIQRPADTMQPNMYVPNTTAAHRSTWSSWTYALPGHSGNGSTHWRRQLRIDSDGIVTDGEASPPLAPTNLYKGKTPELMRSATVTEEEDEALDQGTEQQTKEPSQKSNHVGHQVTSSESRTKHQGRPIPYAPAASPHSQGIPSVDTIGGARYGLDSGTRMHHHPNQGERITPGLPHQHRYPSRPHDTASSSRHAPLIKMSPDVLQNRSRLNPRYQFPLRPEAAPKHGHAALGVQHRQDRIPLASRDSQPYRSMNNGVMFDPLQSRSNRSGPEVSNMPSHRRDKRFEPSHPGIRLTAPTMSIGHSQFQEPRSVPASHISRHNHQGIVPRGQQFAGSETFVRDARELKFYTAATMRLRQPGYERLQTAYTRHNNPFFASSPPSSSSRQSEKATSELKNPEKNAPYSLKRLPSPTQLGQTFKKAKGFDKLDLLCTATLEIGELHDNPTGCSCPKSKCVALYCDCFKAGRRCDPKNCSCIDCKNTIAESGADGARTNAIRCILARNPRAFNTAGMGNPLLKLPPGEIACNCVRSRCLKLYCSCFHNGRVCKPNICTCVGCHNTEEDPEGHRQAAIQQAIEKRSDAFIVKPKEKGLGCACKNNRCIRKYCECYRTGLSCSDKCTCRECENHKPPAEPTPAHPSKGFAV